MLMSLTGLGFAIQARGLCSASAAAMCRVALASSAFHTCCNLMEEEGGCRESLLVMRSPEMFHQSMIQQLEKNWKRISEIPQALQFGDRQLQ
eukprot:4763986-Pyramimonas_sp.AAC.1